MQGVPAEADSRLVTPHWKILESAVREAGQRISDMQVGEAGALPRPHLGFGHLGWPHANLPGGPYLGLYCGDVLKSVQEPPRHATGQVPDVLNRVTPPKGLNDGTQAPVGGDAQPVLHQSSRQVLGCPLVHRLAIRGVGHSERAGVGLAVLEAGPCLQAGLLEAAAYRHDLTSGLHRGSDAPVGGAELVKRPARNLDHAVVQGRLERGRRALAGDRVGQLVESVPDGDERGQSGDWVPCGLGGEGGGARYAGIDFDDAVLPRGLVDGELHVAAPLDVEAPDQLERSVPQHLVVAVGEGLLGGDHDRLAGVDPHWINVLHRTHDYGVVSAITHDLVLVLLPSHDALLDEHLTDCGVKDALAGNLHQLPRVECGATAQSTKCEGRPDEQREAVELLRGDDDLVDGFAGNRPADREVDLLAGSLELVSVLRLVYRSEVAANELDAKFVQSAVVGERRGDVQSSLATHASEQGSGPL